MPIQLQMPPESSPGKTTPNCKFKFGLQRKNIQNSNTFKVYIQASLDSGTKKCFYKKLLYLDQLPGRNIECADPPMT